MKKRLKYIYEVQKNVSMLGGALALLDWDQKTYMPKMGDESRSEQIAYLSKEIHKMLVSEKFFREVNKLRKSRLKGKDRIVVDRLYRDMLISRKLPVDFVEDMSRTVSLAYNAWQEAKEKNNFNIFKPHLEKIVKLKIRECEYLGFKGHPYNGLLNYYEEGMTVEKLKPVFEKLKMDLVELLREIKKSNSYKEKYPFLKKEFDKKKEMKLDLDLKELIGIKEDFSRIDISAHPFTTTIGINDTRITYWFKNKDPMSSFFAVAHEGGHALYELGMPEKYAFTVVHDSPSMGMHESQSRFWENMICGGKYFWQYFYPRFKREFKHLKNVSLNRWYNGVNEIKPGAIRVESDEISYCLHVILRFEIELGLITGKIKVKDLPKIWNQKMMEYLGVVVKKDSEGVLQDMHWSSGDFGYFPTYAIGTIYAAQLYDKMIKSNPKFINDIRRGKFDNILNWLRKNVHRHGREMSADNIIKRACGSGLDPDAYIDYLRKKYLEIYK